MAKKPDKLALALQTVANTPEGRMVIWDLLQFCRVFNSNMQASPQIEGMRNVGLRTLNQILEIDPNIFVGMMRENNPTTFPTEPAETTDEKEDDNAG